jgi:hypothetical protein
MKSGVVKQDRLKGITINRLTCWLAALRVTREFRK